MFFQVKNYKRIKKLNFFLDMFSIINRYKMTDASTNNEVVYFDSDSPVRYNCGKEYYTIKRDDGEHVLYIGRFPLEWAISHKKGTGPNECTNCLHSGSKDGVFIGYCANCADYIYHGTRGKGLYDNFEESPRDKGYSIFDTYLTGMDMTFVGRPFVDIPKSEKDLYVFIRMDEYAGGDDCQEEYQDSIDNEEEIIEYGFSSLIHGDSVFDIDSAAGYNSY